VLDVKKVDNNKWQVFTHNGKNPVDIPPIEIAKTLCDHGAGELVIYSIDKDGTGLGYDLDLIDLFRDAVDVPITAVGGAGSLEDISALVDRFSIIGAGAGDIFVFKGKFKAVLITYPTKEEKAKIWAHKKNI
jgi:cyclase